jgi:transglutaminase-like putative cysteine protease
VLPILLAVLLVAGGIVLAYVLTQPTITSLDPELSEPGSVIVIHGNNFGENRAESRVEVDGVIPTASSYLEWSSHRISLRLPGTVDSGLIFVHTDRGRSNPRLFMNRARLPLEPASAAAGGSGPFLASISVDRGPIGSLVNLVGTGFGANQANSSVRFPWNPEDPPGAPGERSSPKTLANQDPDLGYELWSDREIKVRVPDGAVSGTIFVETAAGDSNGIFFDVSDLPGVKRFFDRRTYSISCSVSLTKIQASGSNEFWLWIPRPVESSSQAIVKDLVEEPKAFNANAHGSVLFRFQDLVAGQNPTVNLSWLVETYSVETRIDPDRIRIPATPGPLSLVYTGADALIPADAPEVVALASKITSGEKNPWRAAKLVYGWLVHNLAWRETRETRRALASLNSRTSDSWNYALAATALLRAAGVPSIPVAGLLVDPSRRTARHSWVEFYVEGFGWVPMDPILGSGARPSSIAPDFEDPARYFGNLDDRRITFSRGFSALEPMAANGRRSTPVQPLGYQAFYEEAAGALEAYSSFWSEVEVTGLY